LDAWQSGAWTIVPNLRTPSGPSRSRACGLTIKRSGSSKVEPISPQDAAGRDRSADPSSSVLRRHFQHARRDYRPLIAACFPNCIQSVSEVAVLLLDYFLTASVLKQQSTARSVSPNGLTAVLRP
jgi:hypothetical protein